MLYLSPMPVRPLLISHSILDAKAVGAHIDSTHRFTEPVRCELLTRGVNDLYRVQADGTRYVARVLRHQGRTHPQLTYEMALTRFFADAGFEVAAPIAAQDGSYFQEVVAPEGVRYLSLSGWAPGEPLWNRPSVADVERLGETVARMHQCCHDFEPPTPVITDTAEYIQGRLPALRDMLRDAPEEAAFYEALAEKVVAQLQGLNRNELPFGPVHGDIHAHNVFLGDEGQLTLIDWDLCGDDYFAQELTAFTWRNLYLDAPKEMNEAYLRGYQSVRRFTDAERSASALFLMAHHLFVLTGMAFVINIVGHSLVGYKHNLARYRQIIEEPARQAGLID